MTTGPTFADSCPQRKSEAEWPDIEKRVEKIEKRRTSVLSFDVVITNKEWRQIKSLLERVR